MKLKNRLKKSSTSYKIENRNSIRSEKRLKRFLIWYKNRNLIRLKNRL